MPEVSVDFFVGKIIRNFDKILLRAAQTVLSDRYDAEDAVQETLMTILNDPEKFINIPDKELPFYLVNIVKHISYNIYNKKNRHPFEDIDDHDEIADDHSVEKTIDDKLMLEEVKEAMRYLCDADYSILWLRFFCDKKPYEIAEELNIPEKNIHKYITRARRRLLKILKKRGISINDL